jgi:hypothetical protein
VEVRIGELVGGDVDRGRQRDAERAAPLGELDAHAVEHEGAERHDDPALLGDGDELRGRDGAEAGMRPARERLDADEAAAAEIHLRLVADFQRPGIHRVAELVLDLQPADQRGARALAEELDAVLAAALGLVERDVGVAQDGLGRGGGGAVGAAEPAADADADEAPLSREVERGREGVVHALRDRFARRRDRRSRGTGR